MPLGQGAALCESRPLRPCVLLHLLILLRGCFIILGDDAPQAVLLLVDGYFIWCEVERAFHKVSKSAREKRTNLGDLPLSFLLLLQNKPQLKCFLASITKHVETSEDPLPSTCQVSRLSQKSRSKGMLGSQASSPAPPAFSATEVVGFP